MTTVAKFDINYHQILNEKGEIVSKNAPDFVKDTKFLRQLYLDMYRLRALDTKAYALQRTGKMGTYPASLGQEAIGVGYGTALKTEDVVVPYYRSTGGLLMHGVTMAEILLYWGGDERGSDFKHAKEDFPWAVPIATQCLNAAGVATAFKLRNQARAAITEIGEGGTSKGDFYEAINVSGIWELPVVYIINNNQWAISVPSEIQTACETYAQKAIAAGIEGVQVDGNDILAMYDMANRSLEKARAGKGATLIEAISYRLCDHTTADDATRYRGTEEVDDAWSKEPMVRMRKYMENLGCWSEEDEQAMIESVQKEVEAAVEEYQNIEPPKPEDMFDSLYKELPEQLVEQREEAIRRGAK